MSIARLIFSFSSPVGTPLLQPVRTLSNPNAYGTSGGDNFGLSVGISGNYAIVGAYAKDDASGTSSGKAYIFDVTNGALLHTLSNPNAYGTSLNDYFGLAVAIEGTVCAVSAHSEDDAGGADSGKVYLFDVLTGSLLQTISNPNGYSTSAADQFGYAISLSGTKLAVGAQLEDDASGTSSGKVYLFDVSSGALLRTFNNPNPYGTSANDKFGVSVSLSDDYVAVGAAYEDDAGGADSGKVYLFDVATGSLLQTISNPNASGTSASDMFGIWVEIDNTKLIVGASMESGPAGANSGVAYIFDLPTGNLLQTLNNPSVYSTGTGDYFGLPASLSGNYALVGAYAEGDTSGTYSGAAYLFDVSSGALSKILLNPSTFGSGSGDRFGRAVAIDGNYAIIGAYQEDESGQLDSGCVYIYQL